MQIIFLFGLIVPEFTVMTVRAVLYEGIQGFWLINVTKS